MSLREERLYAELEVAQAALALKTAQFKLIEIRRKELQEEVKNKRLKKKPRGANETSTRHFRR